MDPLLAGLLFVFSLVVGTYGALIGAGGGFLIVPLLLVALQLVPAQAAGTSLIVVFFNALSGTLSYTRQKRVDFRTGFRFAIATVPGSIFGAYLTKYFTGPFFSILFGLLLLGLAVFLAVRPREAPARPAPDPTVALPRGHSHRRVIDSAGRAYHFTVNEPAGLALSFGLGFLSSMLGIGGGWIHVPVLVYLFAFPAHIATATSLFILTFSTGIGSVSHLLLGNVLPEYAAIMSIGVFLGAQAGAALSRRLRGVWIIRLLSLALVGAGLRLLVGQFAPA